MKKLLTILLLFISVYALGQSYTPPVNPIQVPTMTWYKNAQGMWAFRGSNLGWWLYADSLMVKRMIASAAGGVTSFNSRTGAVVPLVGDYSSFYYPLSSNPAGYSTFTPSGTSLQYIRGNGTYATFPAYALKAYVDSLNAAIFTNDHTYSGIATHTGGDVYNNATSLIYNVTPDFQNGIHMNSGVLQMLNGTGISFTPSGYATGSSGVGNFAIYNGSTLSGINIAANQLSDYNGVNYLKASGTGAGATKDSTLQVNKNLYELANKATSRTNLSVYSKAQSDAAYAPISVNGTVTSFGKTDGIGIISSVANSTTTPNHTIRVDTATIKSKASALSDYNNLVTSISGKQNTLISGTNIKTINSTSLLGSSNILLQTPLIAGTDYVAPTGTLAANTGLPLTTGVTGILPGANGGTGVANTGKTITLGGNLTTSGAFATTLTTTATTNVTLPTTGTLLTSANFVFGEVPSGTVNSSNTAFTLANTPTSGTVQFYINGLRQKLITDYTISGSTITTTVAPTTGDLLLTDYLK